MGVSERMKLRRDESGIVLMGIYAVIELYDSMIGVIVLSIVIFILREDSICFFPV